MKEIGPGHWWYITLKSYLRLIHESLLVRRRYTLGIEKMPKPGERYFIVCNHQNTANDPLNIVFSFPIRYHICALARANVFQVHPWITRFLRWIGLMPAYRFGWEGGEGLEENFQSFDEVAQRVNDGYTVIVFPEAGHTQGHYLDRFTTGTVRMAFHTAQQNGFQEDIKIVPTAHHYEDYFGMRKDFLWMVSDPVSLKPYYHDFQQHPNATMRDITHMLRERIQRMMLDEGKDNYDVKEFLRTSALNPATQQQMPLPTRMEADKLYINSILQSPRQQGILSTARQLKELEESIGTDDQTVALKPSVVPTLLRCLALVLLLPLWVVSLWPHALCYALPPRLIHEDKMFTNSYRYVMSALFLYPLTALLTIVAGLLTGWWWQALLWVALWLLTARFAWWYWQQALTAWRRIRYHLATPNQKQEIASLREKLKNII